MAELIIVFREVLEGALIVGILYTYLNKTEQYGAIKWLWQGVAAAIVASIFGSILFQIFADGFEGRSAKLFEGIVMILAAAMLGTMIVWMAKNRNIAEDLKAKLSKINSFQASFTQQVMTPDGHVLQDGNGSIALEYP